MQENEQSGIAAHKDAELDALRIELSNAKAALATAEAKIAERDERLAGSVFVGKEWLDAQTPLSPSGPSSNNPLFKGGAPSITCPAIIGMDMASGPDITVTVDFHPDDVHKIGQPGAAIRMVERQAKFDSLMEQVANLPPVSAAPFGIHGNKFPGTIWPTPGKEFDLERRYDPMNMKNREGPLKLREDDGKDTPRRRRTDRQSED